MNATAQLIRTAAAGHRPAAFVYAGRCRRGRSQRVTPSGARAQALAPGGPKRLRRPGPSACAGRAQAPAQAGPKRLRRTSSCRGGTRAERLRDPARRRDREERVAAKIELTGIAARLEPDRRNDISTRVSDRRSDARALAPRRVLCPPDAAHLGKIGDQLREAPVPAVQTATSPQRADLSRRAAREQHARGGAGVGGNRGSRQRRGTTLGRRPTVVAQIQHPTALPGEQAHGQAAPLAEISDDRAAAGTKATGPHQDRRERHRPPAQSITAMTDALQEPDLGHRRERLVGERLPDPQTLSRRGHAPLGLFDGEQIEHVSGSHQRSQHRLHRSCGSAPAHGREGGREGVVIGDSRGLRQSGWALSNRDICIPQLLPLRGPAPFP